MTRRLLTRPRIARPPLHLLIVLLVLSVGGMTPLLAATAQEIYTAALAKERALRAPADEPATLEQLRAAISAYDEVVRQYPRSGYSDNALWQAAGLSIETFERFRQPVDQKAAITLLGMLTREYPSSSLVPRAADRLRQLGELEQLDQPADVAQIRAIHREPLADVVRITIELDDEVRYEAELLDGPARLYFDFHGATASPSLRNTTLAFADGDIVREARFGTHPEQTTRVVLDFEDVGSHSVYTLYNPYRLVVDAVPAATMQARRIPGDLPTRAVEPAQIPTTDPVPTNLVAAAAAVATTGETALATGGVDPEVTAVATRPQDYQLLPVPQGWEVRRLDPIPVAFEADRFGEEDDTPPWPMTDEPAVTAGATLTAALDLPDDDRIGAPSSAASGDQDELAWPQVHDVLYPSLGTPPSVTSAVVTTMVTPDEVFEEPAERDAVRVMASSAPLDVPESGAPGTLVFPMSTVDLVPPPTMGRVPQLVRDVASPVPTGEGARVSPDVPVATEPPFANTGGSFSLARQLGLGVSRIVIDPGHGGADPGAQTVELSESALVLDVSHRLAARLEAVGIEVVLTRRSDVYLPLHARTELANRVDADLFLSIHANAASDRSARGIETYYLDFASDADAATLAARENAASREGLHNLPKLVQSITMQDKLKESQDLAGLVQRHLIGGVRELHPAAQDLGVKRAPFVVLIGANMPSVLTEISFLTNQEEAAFLATDAYRDRIADALLESILAYQQTLKPSTSFAAENN
jgi:N-acetylmuramoyl-L-alanine amidase